MIDFKYLSQGVYGLARAHRAGTMAGHLGAAVAAGYFFGEDNADLPEAVFRGVEGELDRVIAGEEAIWFNARQAGVTPTELFEPLPEEEARPEAIKSLATALGKNIGETRQSGHNTIFASIAIRALHDHQDFATPQVVEGIRKLIEGFNNAHAGRGFYGKPRGWLSGNQVKLADLPTFPKYESIQQMAEVTVEELIATAAVRRQGFGGLWHVVNHAAAIAELDRFGYQELALKGLPAHHQHIRLWRSLPDVGKEMGEVEKSSLDPREGAYWQGMLKRDQARLTHRIKTLYGFNVLMRLVDDETRRKQAHEALLYLMA